MSNIEIVKQGRKDFDPEVNPHTVCPYREPFSIEQLAWTIGWYKAQIDYLIQKVDDLKRSDVIVRAVFAAEARGEKDFRPTLVCKVHCPYAGSEYRDAYFAGWDRSLATYVANQNVVKGVEHHPV